MKKYPIKKIIWIIITVVVTVFIVQKTGHLLDPFEAEDGLNAIDAFHELEENLKDGAMCFDIIVPGEYREELHIYNEEKDDGLHNMVGSANQSIWITAHDIVISAGIISSLKLVKEKSGSMVLEVEFYDGKTASFSQ